MSELHTYELLETLGKGTDGIVRRAKKNDQIVAIKIIHDRMAEAYPVSFEREFETHKKFVHPHIVPLYNYYVGEGTAYCVMEACQDPLSVYLSQRYGRLEPSEAIYILNQMCQAVKYLHDLGYSHHDIKPENIVGCGDVWKLADFGFTTDGKTIFRGKIGTYPYMPPEVIRTYQKSFQNVEDFEGTEYEYESKPVDIWSLGILLYKMIRGTFPYSFSDYSYPETVYSSIISDSYTHNIKVVEKLAPHFGNLLSMMLQKDPALRPNIDTVMAHPAFHTYNLYSSPVVFDGDNAVIKGWRKGDVNIAVPGISGGYIVPGHTSASVSIIGPSVLGIFVAGLIEKGKNNELTAFLTRVDAVSFVDNISKTKQLGQYVFGDYI